MYGIIVQYDITFYRFQLKGRNEKRRERKKVGLEKLNKKGRKKEKKEGKD